MTEPSPTPSPAERTAHERPLVRPGERWFLLALTVFSAAALWRSFAISGFSSASGPGVFPMLASGTMLVTSLGLTLSRLRAAGEGPRGLRGLAFVLAPRTALFLVLMLGFVVLIPRLGFMVAAGAFLLAAISLNWRRGGWARRLLASASVTGVTLALVWLVFRLAFQVVLPTGTLWRTVF
ncbi:tripartite tricarboxylate transporter TctB family protein [Acuticoccus sp. I52.16.1]|uniref:tripartite tricarboxylate transporter TctB family protein n=1 Tax=Acuticoccus sp. I52.16.1 TaxID=2928472 RepID=UPI001FD59955|nr:tripartite tricarboxylate transporter TctB family protein [Acuticoccus sp. I52.16.1]UOM37316.1 tripartite tricarboxylate transporter TctB family protein [Acuticoccus sp. I52.16.1]